MPGTGFLKRCFRGLPGVLLAVGLCLPVAAFAACTEKSATNLVTQNLNLRLQFLKNEKRMPVYEAASMGNSARIRQYIGAKDWDNVCREVFRVIAVADDVLAGGNGTIEPLKTPWGKWTPERMFAMAGEFDLVCEPGLRNANCARRELVPLRRELINLKAQAGKGDLMAARYVTRSCELYSQMLSIVRK